jgi:hypothetical protein
MFLPPLFSSVHFFFGNQADSANVIAASSYYSCVALPWSEKGPQAREKRDEFKV